MLPTQDAYQIIRTLHRCHTSTILSSYAVITGRSTNRTSLKAVYVNSIRHRNMSEVSVFSTKYSSTGQNALSSEGDRADILICVCLTGQGFIHLRMSETYNCWNTQKPYLQKEGGSREKPKSFYMEAIPPPPVEEGVSLLFFR